jgi:outer membrane protein assembly factor BamB
VWSFDTEHWVWGTPAFYEGVVYVGDLAGNLYALDASNGEKLWDFRAGAGIRAGIVAGDGVVYAVAMNGQGYALDAESGTVNWQFSADPSEKAQRFLSTPILSGEMLFVVSDVGQVYAFLTETGSKKWVFSPVSVSNE